MSTTSTPSAAAASAPRAAAPWHRHLHERHRDNDLAGGGLNAVEVFGQSIAAAGPSIAIAGTLPLAFFIAGVGSVFSVVIGTVIVLLVAVVVAQFAREHASAGSLYSYAAEGLGAWSGFASGWGLALGYTGIASACAAGVALFGGSFLQGVGLSAGSSTPSLVGLLVAAVALAVVVTVRGVKFSTHVAIVLEGVSLLAIFAVFAAVLAHFGLTVDLAKADAVASPTLNNIAVGAVVAVTVFVGFESAGSLGIEAANPYRAIPRAIYITALGAGALYLVAAVVQLIGLSSGVDTSSAITPFNALATASGAAWLSPVVDAGVAVSSFACVVASITGAARILFNLSREGALPAPLGRAHRRYQTPHLAIGVVAVAALLVPLGYLTAGDQVAQQLWASYAATAIGGTFGYLLAYLLVAISALVHFRRIGRLRPHVAAAAVASVFGIVFVGYNVFRQNDTSLPLAFSILLGLGLVWFAAVWTRRPEQARRVGTFTLARDSAPKTGDGVGAASAATD